MVGRRAGWKRLFVLWIKVMLYCGLIIGGHLTVKPVYTQNDGNGGSVVTAVFNATASDGYLQAQGYQDWYGAWSKDEANSVTDDADYIYCGQRWTISWRFVYRAGVFFDTSSILDTVEIINWTLSIYLYSDYSSDDFNVTVQNGQPTYPHDPMLTSDYDKDLYSGDYARLDTSTLGSTGQYYNFTVGTDGSIINKQGMTKLMLRSDKDIDGQEPSTTEYILFGSKEYGYPAKLYVTYEEPTGPPQWSNLGHNSTEVAYGACMFFCKWDRTLNAAVFSWNYSGNWENLTVSQTGSWTNITKKIGKAYFTLS
ncbi:MAG: hypothetical protein DRN81_06925, partial [Thermoproteota archaeon]